jgi:hypothetical protein
VENSLFQRLFRDAAPRQARADDDLQRDGLVDDEYADNRLPITPSGLHEGQVALPGWGRASIDDLESAGQLTDDLRRKGLPSESPDRGPIGAGIAEDSVAMPGGGQMAIDDLEASRSLTPDLLRKARPEVWEYEESRGRHRAEGLGTDRAVHGMAPPSNPDSDFGFESRARGYDPLTRSSTTHRGPAVDAYAHYVGDTDDMPDEATLARRERLYARAADEANRKGVILPEDVPVADWRTDPIRRIHPGDSPEDERRIEYNQRHVSR